MGGRERYTTNSIRISGRPWRTGPADIMSNVTLAAFGAALEAADPSKLVRNSVRREGDVLRIRKLSINLGRYERIFVLGGGKATGGMATEVERLLGDCVTAGVVNVPDYLPLPKLKKIIPHPATHPYPNRRGLEGVLKMLGLAEKSTSNDLYLCLFSGGGSALMPAPAEGLSLAEKVKTTDLLLKSGANIEEMNVVRKHLSKFKGGRLAEVLSGAEVVSLIISDVPGDRLDAVSSGPTAPDPTTYSRARRVLAKYRIWKSVPKSVRSLILLGEDGKIPDTPKPRSPIFRRVHNVLIGSNRDARLAAYAYLVATGIPTKMHRGFYLGKARDVGRSLVEELLGEIKKRRTGLSALVAGGEATVTVRGKGRGGRDQELILSAAASLRGRGQATIAALATDGVDGPTEAAGAIADEATVDQGLKLGLKATEALRNNDSYGYFQKLGGLLITGPTGTNVNDIVVAMGLSHKSSRLRS
jgi:glycerate 2-kinase